jgi:peptidoglycan hydrolase-like protein with peptidoglycan-binding domain
MLFASKTRWAGSAFLLLTAGMLVPGLLQTAVGSEATSQEVAEVHQSENKKLQETLRNKGHFRGQVDGVFGLRTRASIRAYQKAENLPVTGELDAKTAAKLGLSPEVRERHGAGATKKGKPSAGVKYAKGGGVSNTPRKAVKTVIVPESSQRTPEKTLQAESDNRSQ